MANDEKPIWTKIGFQQSIQDLIRYGPSIAVGIAAADASSPTVEALALFDTGASGCGISPRLTEQLNLEPIDAGVIHEAGREPITANIFSVRLFVPRMDVELDIAGLPSLAEPHDILIGRDFLANFRLLVDFTTGGTQLHFKNAP